jgi:phenylpyruvate tautomerase PptA (4-oxalocrotonate tautomerase family)
MQQALEAAATEVGTKTWKVVMSDPSATQVIVEDVQTQDGGFDAIVRASMRWSGHPDDGIGLEVMCAICGDEVVYTSDTDGATTAFTDEIIHDHGSNLQPVEQSVYVERCLGLIHSGDDQLKAEFLAASRGWHDDWADDGEDDAGILRRAIEMDYMDGFEACINPRSYY